MTSLSYLSPIRKFAESDAWVDNNKLWIQVYPYDTWDHPIYGATTIDRAKADDFVKNFHENVRGQELATSYEHGLDPAKGTKASGWIREVEARDDGFYAFVEFTETAKKEIDEGEWKYFSGEHWEEWKHPQTSETHRNVFDGAGLTNKPWVKGMVPINLSELVVEKEEETTEEEEEVITMDDATEQALRTALNVNEDADLVATVTSLIEEVGPLRTFAEEHQAKKQFSEMFPAEARRMAELEVTNRNNEARRFSESLKTKRFKIGDGDEVKETTQGLSGLAITEIEEAHKKFSEGVGGLDTFTGAISAIFDNGVVDYGEHGSSHGAGNDDEEFVDTNINDYQEARRMFSERVDIELAEAKKDGKEMKYNEAMAIAGMKYPKLYESYRRPPVTA